MQKLSNVESQRMMLIVGDMTDRIKYLSYVPLQSAEDLIQHLTENQSKQAGALLCELWELEKLCLGAHDKEVEEKVKMTARRLCRELKGSSVAIDVLYHHSPLTQDQSETLELLVKTLSDLSVILQRQSQRTSEESKMNKEIVQVAETRVKHSEDELRLTRDNLKQLRKTKQEQVRQLEEQIQKLQLDLRTTAESVAAEFEAIEIDLQGAQIEAHEAHLKELSGLTDKTAFYLAQNEKMKQDHREVEDLLRKKKVRLAAECKALAEKHHQDMKSILSEFEELERVHSENVKKCEMFEKHFTLVDEEQIRIDAEEALIQERSAEERAQKQVLEDAATMIQKMYRGYVCRSAYKKLMAKRKKAKKTKKKGKPKK